MFFHFIFLTIFHNFRKITKTCECGGKTSRGGEPSCSDIQTISYYNKTSWNYYFDRRKSVLVGNPQIEQQTGVIHHIHTGHQELCTPLADNREVVLVAELEQVVNCN